MDLGDRGVGPGVFHESRVQFSWSMVAVEYGFGPQPRDKDQKADQEDIQAFTFHVHLDIEFQWAIGPAGRKEGFFKIHILTYPLARGKEIVLTGMD
jgi:hypothetical protein